MLWANKNDRMLERVQHKIVKKNQNRAKIAGSTTQSRRWHNQRVDKDQVVEKNTNELNCVLWTVEMNQRNAKFRTKKIQICHDFANAPFLQPWFSHYSDFQISFVFFCCRFTFVALLIFSSSKFSVDLHFPHLILSILIRWSGLYANIAKNI